MFTHVLPYIHTQEAEQHCAQLQQALAQQQSMSEAAQRAEHDARVEAAAATGDTVEELAEARANLAAREEWVAGLQAEASALQVGCVQEERGGVHNVFWGHRAKSGRCQEASILITGAGEGK